MSTRHIKKVFGTSPISTESVPEDDEDYESDNDKPRANSYAILEIQSIGSESETESAQAVTASAVKPNVHEGTKKEKKKKNNKKKSKKSQISTVDDIDVLVREVNAVLGEPSYTVMPDTKPKQKTYEKIFSVKKQHLNFTNELNRFFGSEKKSHNQVKDALKNQIAPFVDKLRANGLSMSLLRTENGITYYCYDHSPEYQKLQTALLDGIQDRDNRLETPLQTSLKNLHVEGILEAFVLFCRGEDYTAANMSIEQIISFLQFVAHPFFNITNVRTRLEYKFLENRPFHIALLVYSHILSNKACHRTALELAKLLLNLDPSDPLNVMFILDVFAIRAREYSWLIEAVDLLDSSLNIKFLFNIQYSYAMAHFHVAMKNKEDLSKADDLLKKALIMFPVALNLLLPASAYKDARSKKLLTHPIYNFKALRETCKPLHDLIALHAAFIGSRWTEPKVLSWMVRNALELLDQYDKDLKVKEEYEHMKQVRQTLFRTWPIETYRHICLLKPMSNLIVDGAVPNLPGYERMKYFNPAPDSSTTINRYNYDDFRVFIID